MSLLPKHAAHPLLARSGEAEVSMGLNTLCLKLPALQNWVGICDPIALPSSILLVQP